MRLPAGIEAATASLRPARELSRQLVKRGLSQCLRPARHVGALPLARDKLSAADVLDGNCKGLDPEVFRHSFRVQEAPRPSEPGTPPARPVETRHLVVDTTDPRFCCRNNHVTGPGNIVIYEDECAFEGMPVRLRLLERPRRIDGTVAYVSNTTPGNYYHWLAFCLPLVGIYRTQLGIEPDFYYVGRPLTRWHIETLAHAGVSADRVLNAAVAASRIVADIPSRSGAVDSAMLAFSRSCFAAPQASPSRRLFIGRRDASHRLLVNEQECADHAARYGFEYVTMSGRSVAEQAGLFAEARYIVAPHGAALTNLLFATPETRVLELLPGDPFIPHREDMPLLLCFREIAALLGCHYRHVVGSAVAAQRHRCPVDADFAADPEAFRAELAALLGAGA